MTAGVASGWFVVPHHLRPLAYFQALVQPVCVATLCVASLHRHLKHSRWLVPLLVIGVMLNVVGAPHDTWLTTVALTAGGLAIVTTLFGQNRSAIVAVLLCCIAIAATLLVGLAR